MKEAHPLTALLDSAARERGNEVSIIDPHRGWTPKQLLARADTLAKCLNAVGVRPGDRVLVRGRNSGDLVARIFAAWRLGAIVVPIHEQVGANRLAAIVADALPSAYVVDDALTGPEHHPALPDHVAVIVSSAESVTPVVARNRATLELEPPGDSAALLIYTSGSTAAPLGVACPGTAIIFALDAIHQELGYNDSDRVLGLLPLAFDYGLYQVLLALKAHAVVILEDGLQHPHRIPRLLAEQSISVFPALPSIFGSLLRARWLATEQRTLRLLTSTGESFPPAMVDQLRSCFPTARVAPMYGLTECKRVSIQGVDVPNSARYSVGRALPGTTAWVGDGLGRPMPPGEEGELFVRGPHLMTGYWRNAAATTVRYQDIGGERTLRSGDIFQMDEAGYLTFVRREGGFLKAKGQRFSPAEIEASLVTLPEVSAAVAVGYINPDGEDSVAMFVVGDAIAEARVRQHCARHLQRAAMPTLIHILDEPLPSNGNGKYDRRALAAFAQELSMHQRHRR